MSVQNIKYVPSSLAGEKRPNQSLDIFKRRVQEMKEKKLEEEISSSNKQAKSILALVAGALFVMILAVGGIYGYKTMTQKVVFCSDTIEKPCLPCPSHGDCVKGELICWKNYVRTGNECVEDKEVIQKAYKQLEKIESYVIGKSIESYLKDRSKYWMSINDIEILFIESENVKDKTSELLNMGKANKLISEHFNGVQHFSAKVPYLKLVNIIQIFWEDNLYYIISAFLLFAYIIFKLIKIKKQRVLKSKANEMYEMIRTQLKANVDDTPEHGVAEDTLKDEIFSTLSSYTGKLLWPLIEELRKKDKQVSKFEIHVAGRPVMLWQWTDIRSSKSLTK